MATQFHPEATEAMLARWTATGTDELTEVGLTAADLMTATRVNVAVSAPNAARLVRWFCEHVAGAMPAVASAKEGEATVGHNDQ